MRKGSRDRQSIIDRHRKGNELGCDPQQRYIVFPKLGRRVVKKERTRTILRQPETGKGQY